MNKFRLFVYVPRSVLVRLLPRGFWRTMIPRKADIHVCIVSRDVTDVEAAAIRRALSGAIQRHVTITEGPVSGNEPALYFTITPDEQ